MVLCGGFDISKVLVPFSLTGSVNFFGDYLRHSHVCLINSGSYKRNKSLAIGRVLRVVSESDARFSKFHHSPRQKHF